MENNMIEEKLEIIIPTYNRAKYLDNTLSQLLKSPFKKCKLTIIDNASSDNTPEICKKYKSLFHDLHIIRNNINIGGNANITKAYITGTKKYSWVLGDNDDYDFTNCEDILNAIKSEEFDIILVCSTGQNRGKKVPTTNYMLKEDKENRLDQNNPLITDAKHLLKIMGSYYFHNLGFISAYIYKTELWDSQCVIDAYNNIPNIYPHYAFTVKSIEENFSIYKSETDIIIERENPEAKMNIVSTGLNWITGWLNSSALIKDKKIREISLNKFFETNSLLFLICSCLIIDKTREIPNLFEKITKLANALILSKGFLKGSIYSLILLLTYYLIPKKICKIIYNKHESKKLD